MDSKHEFVEQTIADALAKSDYDAATTLALRTYGPSVLGFLEVRMRDTTLARDVFAWFAEDLWRSFATFRGACSVKTWSFALARNAANRYVRRELRDRAMETSLSRIGSGSVACIQPITSAPSKLDADARIRALREQLEPDELLLLSLRIDQDLDWREIAVVMLFEGEPPAATDISRETARLRQRFKAMKDKLRKLAEVT
jgi:RNA polymerase sigma-70 factor (ECF subfamily)